MIIVIKEEGERGKEKTPAVDAHHSFNSGWLFFSFFLLLIPDFYLFRCATPSHHHRPPISTKPPLFASSHLSSRLSPSPHRKLSTSPSFNPPNSSQSLLASAETDHEKLPAGVAAANSVSLASRRDRDSIVYVGRCGRHLQVKLIPPSDFSLDVVLF